MMNLEQVVHNFCNQEGELGNRTRMALSYRDAVARGDLSEAEYQELMEDLTRLGNIQLAADELDQQVAFYECIQMLKNIPIS